ncbi:hypothetical protein MNBD_BACTEROID01-1105 [hydrothermal vent metagenome]|uniref:Secretion system C-terminal sorting domain-containing protein n=1 Tax=hydrothermal vent metagenome TaxID=652676 RepID=A0A3B0TWE2_9ZZZZ
MDFLFRQGGFNATPRAPDKDMKISLYDHTSGNNFAGINDNFTGMFETKDFATGIDDLEKPEFIVYPKVFTGHINISNAYELEKIKITTLHGQTLEIIKNPPGYISLGHLNLAPGIYLVQLFGRDGERVGKVEIVKNGYYGF